MLSTCRHATRSASVSVTRLVPSRLITGRRHVSTSTPVAAPASTFASTTATSTSTTTPTSDIPTLGTTSGTGSGSDSGSSSGSGSGSGSGSNGMQPSKSRHTTTVLGTAVLAAFFTIYVTSKVQEARERKQREAELKALGIDPSTPGASTIVNKLLINSPRDVVTESIEGALLSNPGWTAIDGFPEVKVIVRADWNRHSTRQVAIISGGGDGHAPAHSGYVGDGMLTAAVSGNVFASPSVTAILAAIRTVARPHGPGVLLIVKNYTGDRLNFGIAAEQAKNEGIPVQMVIVGDDVSLPRSKGITGRRGLAGTVFVHKVAGAAARNGATLQDVTQAAAQAAASVATLGVATSSCTLPGQKRTERLSADEMEIGMGIHGESGLIRTPLTSANEIVTTLIDTLLSVDPQRDYFMTGTTSTQRQRVALMVNNLGASTPAEINIATRHAVKLLQSRGIAVERVYSGMFMSALDMTGYSISVMRVDDKMVRLLDQTTNAPAWPTQRWSPGSIVQRPTLLPLPTSSTPSHILPAFKSPSTPTGRVLLQTLDAISQALIRAEPQLNKLDSIAGDGDCGSTHRRGAEKILSHLRPTAAAGLASNLPADDIAATMEALALSVGNTMGGSSGALYQLGATAAARELRQIQAKKRGKEPLDAAAFVVALQAGMSAMSTYGGAQEGYRTMLDAWGPAIRTLESALKQGQSTAQAVQAAAQAASLGADATCNLAAQAGRSNYVPDALLRQTPDPGAKAVALTWKAVADTLAMGTTPTTTTTPIPTTFTPSKQ